MPTETQEIKVRTVIERPPQTIYCPACYDDDYEIILTYEDAALVVFEGKCISCGGTARLEYDFRKAGTQ